jgi:hypothetical protein
MKPDGAHPDEATDVRVLFEEVSATLLGLVSELHRLEIVLGSTAALSLPQRSQCSRVAVELGGLSAVLRIAGEQVQRCRGLLTGADEAA